jgi:hypothetical protein
MSTLVRLRAPSTMFGRIAWLAFRQVQCLEDYETAKSQFGSHFLLADLDGVC